LIPEDLRFDVGERVRHEHFGEGVVRGIRKVGKLTHARIDFEEHGDRLVILEYANLRRLRDE
jgi:hypothetical protein